MGIETLFGDVRDEFAPFLAIPAGLVFVVQDGGGEGASDAEKNEPVARGEAEAGEASNVLSE